MAKARKKTRKAAAKRPAKKAKRKTTAKLKGRKVAKVESEVQARQGAESKACIAGAVQTVTDAFGLHNRLAAVTPSKTETFPAF